MAQLSLSVPLLSVLIAPVIAGLLTDRIGRKRLLLLSIVAVGAGSLLSAVTASYPMFLLGRTVAGLFSSLCLVIGRAVVSDMFDTQELSVKVARFTLAPIVAMIVAPLVGAFIVDWYGWRFVFACLTALSVMVALLIAFGLPETLVRVTKDEAQLNWSRLLNLHLWAYVLQSSLHYGLAIGFCSAAAFIITHELNQAAWVYSLGLAMMLVGLAVGVRLFESLSAAEDQGVSVIRGCATTFVVAVLTYASLWTVDVSLNGWVVFFPVVIVAVGVGYTLPPSQTGILVSVPGQAGAASGLASAFQMVSAAIFIHLMTPTATAGVEMLNYYIVAALGAAFLVSLFLVKPGSHASIN